MKKKIQKRKLRTKEERNSEKLQKITFSED